ncbi:hypothetical protein [Vibrio sp. SCSIO 43169]|uniref:hypothetical protein n=1 Tax=Vibrio sp. SCSIO 43169 TaxID=2822801 RepID=UPI002043240C|nr:hypothetical protein [Vibrio sp. SCSIO 43169]
MRHCILVCSVFLAACNVNPSSHPMSNIRYQGEDEAHSMVFREDLVEIKSGNHSKHCDYTIVEQDLAWVINVELLSTTLGITNLRFVVHKGTDWMTCSECAKHQLPPFWYVESPLEYKAVYKGKSNILF